MKRKILLPFLVSLLLLLFAPAGAVESVAAPPASEQEAAVPVSQSDPEKVKTWGEQDPWGVSMSLMAMTIVFLALLVLYICFRAIGKTLGRTPAEEPHADEAPAAAAPAAAAVDNEEVMAAIGLALSQSLNVHDPESGIITLKPHSTEWNSHIDMFHTNPKA